MALVIVLGVLSDLGSLCTGFYIQDAGFSWPFLFASIFHLLNLIYVLGMLKEPQCPSVQNPTLKQNSSSQRAAAEPSPQTRCFYGVYLLFAASTRRQNVVLLLILSAFVFYKVIKNG